MTETRLLQSHNNPNRIKKVVFEHSIDEDAQVSVQESIQEVWEKLVSWTTANSIRINGTLFSFKDLFMYSVSLKLVVEFEHYEDLALYNLSNPLNVDK